MKKILSLILVCFLALTAVACGNTDQDLSEPEFTVVDDNSKDNSDNASRPDVSVPDVSVPDVSVPDDTPEVDFTNKFISWGKHYQAQMDGVYATDATSLQISKLNEPVKEFDIGVFTSDYGKTIESEGQTYADFAVVVFEYSHKLFGYTKTSFSDVGEADASTEIPDDGFVAVIHKTYPNKISSIKYASEANAVELLEDKSVVEVLADFGGAVVFYPHGFLVNDELDTKIKKASSAPKIDGKVSRTEYGEAIWEIDHANELASYARFELNNYVASADVYLTYDKDFLYIGVNVSSPYHHNETTSLTADQMWRYESIQVNLSSLTAKDDYISDHWDNVNDATASNANVVRQYGFCVNENDETFSHVWIGAPGKLTTSAQAVCKRDDYRNLTCYEIAIPWTELGSEEYPLSPEKGTEFGFSVSINSGNADREFIAIPLRDGGGIIGINDWTKIPTITLN